MQTPLSPFEEETIHSLGKVISEHLKSENSSLKSRRSSLSQNQMDDAFVERLPVEDLTLPAPEDIATTLANQRAWRVPWKDSYLGSALGLSTKVINRGLSAVTYTTKKLVSGAKTIGRASALPTKTFLNIAEPVENRISVAPILTPLLSRLLDILSTLSSRGLDVLDSTVSAGLGFVTFIMDLLGDTVQDPTGGILGSFFEFLDLLRREFGKHPQFTSLGIFRIARALVCWWSIQQVTDKLWIESLGDAVKLVNVKGQLKRRGHMHTPSIAVKLTVNDPEAGQGLVDIVQGVLTDDVSTNEVPSSPPRNPPQDDFIDLALLLRYAPLSHGAYGQVLMPAMKLLTTARNLMPGWMKGGVRGLIEKVHDAMDIYDTDDIEFDEEPHSPNATSPTSPKSPMPQPRSFDDLLRVGVVKSPSNQAFSPISPQRDLVDTTSSWAHPTFYILEDPKTKQIVLTLRGTASLQEVMVDLTCAYTPYIVPANGETVLCHGGILLAASYLMEREGKVVNALDRVLTKRSDWGLTIVGHSLGAALASILSISWADPDTCLIMANVGLPAGRRLKVFAYGMPCVFDSKGCEMTEKLVTSLVVSSDFISRLCVGTVTDLRDVIVALCEEDATLDEVSRRIKDCQNGDEEAVLWCWSLRKGLMATLAHGQDHVGLDRDLHYDANSLQIKKLYPAGRIVWIREGEKDARLGRDKWIAYDVKRREAVFSEFLFGELMFLDHLPGCSEEVLRDLVDY
jgi:hypothetical protein